MFRSPFFPDLSLGLSSELKLRTLIQFDQNLASTIGRRLYCNWFLPLPAVMLKALLNMILHIERINDFRLTIFYSSTIQICTSNSEPFTNGYCVRI